MDDLTISIGTLGNYPALADCLRSICREEDPHLSYRIVVVNNGITDHRVSDAIRKDFPRVALIEKQPKLGYCVPHNLVMKGSTSRYVLLLDDDTIVQAGALATMVNYMDKHPDVGIAGCKTLNPDGTLHRTYGRFYTLKTELLNALKISSFYPDRLYRDLSSAREVEWISGAFMLVRAAVIQQVGVLDERYYTLICEPDWCYRVHRAGWKVVFVPEAEIIHIGGEHSFNIPAKSYTNLVRYHVNRYYFFLKHYGRLNCFLLRPIMILGMTLRMVFYGLLYLLRAESREESGKRVKAFGKVVQLSLSAAPYTLPRELREDGSIKGDAT